MDVGYRPPENKVLEFRCGCRFGSYFWQGIIQNRWERHCDEHLDMLLKVDEAGKNEIYKLIVSQIIITDEEKAMVGTVPYSDRFWQGVRSSLQHYGVRKDCQYTSHVCGYIWMTRRKGIEYTIFPTFDGKLVMIVDYWVEKPRKLKRKYDSESFEGFDISEIVEILKDNYISKSTCPNPTRK